MDIRMRTKEEILKEINSVMDEKVAPNVAMHGGDVKVLDFDMDTGTLRTIGTSSERCVRSSIPKRKERR